VISLQDLPPEVLESPIDQAPQASTRTVAAPAPVAATVAERPEPLDAAPALASASGAVSAGAVAVAVPVVAPGGTAVLAVAEGAAQLPAAGNGGWEHALEAEVQRLLAGGQAEVWNALTRRFESRLIRTALAATHGRRMEAAQRLGIGRNTITRKIQELGLDAPDEGL
jgi:two-component system nitrogen regulation response regulator GlnG